MDAPGESRKAGTIEIDRRCRVHQLERRERRRFLFGFIQSKTISDDRSVLVSNRQIQSASANSCFS